ncbi:ribosome biogenesis GTPase YqeH [Acetilactobacillus jinshanensis]|uniref:Ribosome biogenesis GTPase YqeH n=1 Tax=Acetilactobacillus jinshanensis TaxID=1720083 RepID=A0A4P6ZLU2_9LACO|nr:ribosome biogenesis GTPase YqeH [Acetilactobacillus jinshanensis]QBP18668.1 ribosome biogenesis GTPase YqeH [Acetilactobacillus jinshanensis]URL61544.1 ribosome biogenesis GTPase YqeH [uncultured bacterium]
MTKNNDDVLRCVGCGAPIQTKDPNKLGYIPKSAYEKNKQSGKFYCQRCFRLRHYSQIAPVSLTSDDFLKLLNQIQNTDALVVCMVDIFDFNGSLIPGINRFAGNNPVMLVGNKSDLLPKSFKLSKLEDWMRQQANLAGIRPVDVELVSAKTDQQVDHLLEKIDQYRHGRDVYVVGVTNVGKSTLINQIIRDNTGMRELITTSRFPGTTLDQIKIPLSDGHHLIDTPGIIHNTQITHYLKGNDLKVAAPKKRIKPREYQLNPGQTIFMGGLGRFDYLKGRDKCPVTVYVYNKLLVHRTKLSNADEFYKRHVGELLTPPSHKYIKDFPPLIHHQFKTTYRSDLVIAGLGWITIPANIVIDGWAPKGVAVMIRRAMI